jgi:hypothetical protein
LAKKPILALGSLAVDKIHDWTSHLPTNLASINRANGLDTTIIPTNMEPNNLQLLLIGTERRL